MLFFGHNSSVSAPILLIFSAKEEPNHYPIIFYAKNKDSRQLWIIGLISYLPWDTVQRCVLTGFFCFLSCIRGYLHRYVDFLDFTGSLYLNWTSEVILTIQVCTQCTHSAHKVHTRCTKGAFCLTSLFLKLESWTLECRHEFGFHKHYHKYVLVKWGLHTAHFYNF